MKIYSKWLLLSAFLAVCVSCRESRHNQMERLVQEWNGKEIRFPSHPVFTRFVTDTVPYRIPKNDYKVVVFVDSVGCISCKLQLPKWKEFMHEVDSLCEGKVSFVFFFQSADVRNCATSFGATVSRCLYALTRTIRSTR